jgi:hypothetical protein
MRLEAYTAGVNHRRDAGAKAASDTDGHRCPIRR